MEEPRKCRICGVSITNGSRVFCSKECKLENRRRTREHRTPVEFNCLICNSLFIQKRKDNNTCSTSCSQKLWIKNNPEKNKNRNNGEEAKVRRKNWIKNNYQRFREIQNKSKNNRFKNNINYRLNILMGNAIRNTVKDKGVKKWEKLVGYSINTLQQHLETTLPESVSWNDYLEGGYHIDHIIPISMFNFESYQDPEFKKCWNYRNLRIINGYENLLKLATYDPDLIKRYNISYLLPKTFNISLTN
jgi:predicted nucleic acid-binding Zn ribbon protein